MPAEEKRTLKTYLESSFRSLIETLSSSPRKTETINNKNINKKMDDTQKNKFLETTLIETTTNIEDRFSENKPTTNIEKVIIKQEDSLENIKTSLEDIKIESPSKTNSFIHKKSDRTLINFEKNLSLLKSLNSKKDSEKESENMLLNSFDEENDCFKDLMNFSDFNEQKIEFESVNNILFENLTADHNNLIKKFNQSEIENKRKNLELQNEIKEKESFLEFERAKKENYKEIKTKLEKENEFLKKENKSLKCKIYEICLIFEKLHVNKKNN